MSELKRQAVKVILQEMSDNSEPARQVMLKAIEENWVQEKIAKEIIKSTDMTKTFDYFTDRIMSVFEETK